MIQDEIERVLITREQIDERVAELGRELVEVYGRSQDLTIVAVLSGSVIFLADLMRQIPFKMKIALITVSSYAGATTESKGATLVQQLRGELAGRDVLIVDDILDTGNTLRLVQSEILRRRPASLRTCVLLRKPGKAPDDVTADFVGFDIDDVFVVGYGLDYNNLFRNYPHIGVLQQDSY
jgi:hypoxanthine phosphoribosyltransferase